MESEASEEYQPSDVSDDGGSEDDSDEDYLSIAEDESESGGWSLESNSLQTYHP